MGEPKTNLPHSFTALNITDLKYLEKPEVTLKFFKTKTHLSCQQVSLAYIFFFY